MKKSSSHKLGYESIDKEHEKMFHQLEYLSTLMYNRSEEQILLKLIDRVIQESVAHNFSEESLMHDIQNFYDEIEPHILEHRLIVKELLDLRRDIQSSLIESQLEFKRLLRKWQDHLFKYDKRFVEILLEHEASKIDENNNDENSAE